MEVVPAVYPAVGVVLRKDVCFRVVRDAVQGFTVAEGAEVFFYKLT
jgi:hypothetical protein